MKRVIVFPLLIAALVFCNSNDASAQCNESATTYECLSVSGNDIPESNSETWYANAGVYSVSVSLATYHPTLAFASAEIYGADYWSKYITEGYYTDSFTYPGGTGGTVSLATGARYGMARISASW